MPDLRSIALRVASSGQWTVTLHDFGTGDATVKPPSGDSLNFTGDSGNDIVDVILSDIGPGDTVKLIRGYHPHGEVVMDETQFRDLSGDLRAYGLWGFPGG